MVARVVYYNGMFLIRKSHYIVALPLQVSHRLVVEHLN